jgi:excisionase family DNA binding protein
VCTAEERDCTISIMTEHDSAQTAPSIEPLLRVGEVALILRRSRGFVYTLIQDGELHPFRVGAYLRFTADDVRAYLDRRGPGASAPA